MNTSNENYNVSYHEDKVLFRIKEALKGIRYGSLVITVHDSKIVQIERNEKKRYDDLNLENGDGI